MPDKHALLSASSSHRWLNCPPSALLCAKEKDTESPFALEGSEAHSLCEFKLNKFLGNPSKNPTGTLKYFDEEMENCAEEYVQYVTDRIEKTKESCKDPIVLVEQRLDFSSWVPEGFGTGDCVIVADETLSVIDFKYGAGVTVDAEKNPQLMCYALGAVNLFDALYDIKSISMTIYQPRRENISSFIMSKDELLTWAKDVLLPAALLASKGEGEFKAGAHCQFCKVKSTCRQRTEYSMELARYDFEMPPVLTDTEIEIILEKVDALVSWAGDIKEYALKEALSGKVWTGWKLVEGRSIRKYTDEKEVAKKVKEAGYDPYEYKVLGITAMTKLLGKKKFDELLKDLVHKPQGKPTLVPETDKRPVMNTAANDFKEEN